MVHVEHSPPVPPPVILARSAPGLLKRRVPQAVEAAVGRRRFLGPDASQTCYTDASGTRRTAYVAPEALLAFAHAVIDRLATAGRHDIDAS